MSVENVHVGELETFKRGLSAFNEMFTGDAEVVDLVAGSRQIRVVAAPVYLDALLAHHALAAV